MSWTIELSIAILLTSLTGTIVYAIWYGISRIFERFGYLNVIYQILRGALFFWIFHSPFYPL